MPGGRRTALGLTLAPEQWEVLWLTQQRAHPAIDAQMRERARIVLLLAQGHTITAIARHVRCSRLRVYRWVERWQTEGLRGLRSRPAGAPRKTP